ncbi:hypothetical protein L2E82_30716 [Cichorium intybus]|uniref:Uncharacterized protein n=1 Tax=Cichorium intybus TaxID=13427 RepID=A0ACB9D1B2_CICIN|nr:hypothetical protein L2E82_30716 [Cichorium intybus]
MDSVDQRASSGVDHPTGDDVDDGLYEAMRKELRSAVNEIMIGLEQTMERKPASLFVHHRLHSNKSEDVSTTRKNHPTKIKQAFGRKELFKDTLKKAAYAWKLLTDLRGYDLLGCTNDQIRTTEQVNAAMAACNALKLDGLIIVGGVTSNTDAAQLAETFSEAKCFTKVVGVPVTLNGDLKNQFVEAIVGFDTICTVNSQLISNVCTDALSAEKYYYFIRLMGRKASHVALECTLQSHPNLVILGEEVAASKLTIRNQKSTMGYGAQFAEEKQRLFKLMRNLNFYGKSGSEPLSRTTQSSIGIGPSVGFYSPDFRGDFGAGLLDLQTDVHASFGLPTLEKESNSRENNMAKIKVVVRKRPLNKKEVSRKADDILSPSANSLTVDEPKLKVDLTAYAEKHDFCFDLLFVPLDFFC